MKPPLSSGRPHWHVVQTKPGQEFRALEHLQEQHYFCFLPTLNIEDAGDGQTAMEVAPLFPRYLFIRLDAAADHWSSIRGTHGVCKLIAFDGQFAILPDECVEALCNSQGGTQLPLFQPTETPAMPDRPLHGLEAVFQMADGEARAMLLIEFLSRLQMNRPTMEAVRQTAVDAVDAGEPEGRGP